MLFRALRERVAADDASGAQKLSRLISNALLTRSFHERPGEWDDAEDAGSAETADILPPSMGDGRSRRPYFEVLFVNSMPPARWPAMAAELRRLRRPEDEFLYEPVFVGSFEDAFCAAAVNPALAAVVLAEGFPYRSRHDAPALRAILDPLGEPDSRDELRAAPVARHQAHPAGARHLSAVRTRRRNARRQPQGRSDPAHLLRRRGAARDPSLDPRGRRRTRYETPFFDNLKKYARRPIGTFHALPIARGKSVFKSDWIRDMGEFYGINLFLAESSATTGGLDSLLEPTGNIKRAQELAARAFGADHVFFVTNGTSTSNKMAVQALLAPGDIAIVDRNCHKSHHYGMVLSGRAAALCRSVPDDAILDVRRGAARTIKRAMLGLKAEGRLTGCACSTSPTAPSTGTCTTCAGSWRNAWRSSRT